VAASTAFVKTATYMVWGGYAPGTLNATFTPAGRWTTPAAITVTGLDINFGSSPTCSTGAKIGIYDTTASASVIYITLSTGQAGYTASGPDNVAAGHILQLEVISAGTCGTYPQIAEYAVTYQMQ
jgi:hypothetical protein